MSPRMKPFQPVDGELRGFQMIEASAGCGKTYTITSLFLRLALEAEIDPEEILVVTFTEAAASELKERIRSRIEAVFAENQAAEADDAVVRRLADLRGNRLKSLLRQALRKMDRAAISTIHGFCRRVLSEQAFESGTSFDAELVTDKDALFEEAASDYFARITASASPLMLEYLEHAKIKPESFKGVLNTVLRAGRIRVLPPKGEITNPSADFESVLKEIQSIFHKDYEGVQTFFLKCPELRHQSYSQKNVPKWLRDLRTAAESAAPDLSIFEAARRFSTAFMSERTKEGAEPPEHPLRDAADRLMNVEQRLIENVVQLKRRFADEAEQTLDVLKREREIQTFDDLMRGLHNALEGSRRDALVQALRGKYKAVLIDEFQDTDSVQFEIFHTLFGGEGEIPFFAIGDPKQAIYGFRGGDIYTYLRAAAEAGERRYTLGVNYRSDPAMIQGVNGVFGRLDNPFLFDKIGFEATTYRPGATDAFVSGPAQGALALQFVGREDFGMVPDKPLSADFADTILPGAVAGNIEQLLSTFDAYSRPITPSRIAVLVRSNSQATNMRDALALRGIDAVLLKDQSVFETPEAESFGRLLKAVYQPSRLTAVRAALATPLLGLTAREIADLLDDPSIMDAWAGRFSAWRKTWMDSGIYKMFQEVSDCAVDGVSIEARMLTLPEGERAMTNYRHLAELIGRRRTEAGMTESGLLKWYERRCIEAKDRPGGDEEALRLESDREAIRVLTMHKSKGLEFDIVFCPYLWSSAEAGGRGDQVPVFHDKAAEDLLTADLSYPPAAAYLEQAAFEARAESIRLAYVALTRAKQRCFVILGAFKGLSKSPAARLFFSAEPPSETVSEAMSDADLRAAAERVSDTVGASLSLSQLQPPPSAKRRPVEVAHENPPPVARTLSVRLPQPLIQTSFSALTAARREFAAALPFADEDRDDDGRDVPAESPEISEHSSGSSLSLMTFDRGARAGTCLHAIFERLDFEHPQRGIFAETLREHGYGAEWIEPLYRDLTTVLQKPLRKSDPLSSLSQLPLNARANELSFLFPVQGVDRFAAGLEILFAKHCGVCGRDYTDSLGRLSRGLLDGFVKGFIDLVYEYRGRYYIVDYKSNHLGDRPSDYTSTALRAAMASHHYYLQYHIYTAALDRHLGNRLPNYDYNTHFGGVYYLFFRGMTGDSGQGGGVFFDRPPEVMIRALSDLFEGTPVPEPTTKKATAPVSVSATEQLSLPGFMPSPETQKKRRR